MSPKPEAAKSKPDVVSLPIAAKAGRSVASRCRKASFELSPEASARTCSAIGTMLAGGGAGVRVPAGNFASLRIASMGVMPAMASCA